MSKMVDNLTSEPKIMCVGANFFDIVQTCRQYIAENTKSESTSVRYQRGGNASNTATVIAELGYPVELFTVFGDCDFSDFVKEDLRKNKIEFSRCPTVKNQKCPIATAILSEMKGSRTIAYHDAEKRELTVRDFEKVNLTEYSWIHFEGRRNIADIVLMIEMIRNHNKSLVCQIDKSNGQLRRHHLPITVSVELEQPDDQLLRLIPHADVVFISKELAGILGCKCMSEGIQEMRRISKTKKTIINAWGDKGAAGYSAFDEKIVESVAFPPAEVIDTLGAGDTFNAAVVYFLNKAKLSSLEGANLINYENEFITGPVLEDALIFGCRIAGIKVGIRGYSGLRAIYEKTSKIY